MATWESIISNPDFQKQSSDIKKAVRDSYFEDNIRPKVERGGGNVEAVRSNFNSEFPFEDEMVERDVDGMAQVPQEPKQEEKGVGETFIDEFKPMTAALNTASKISRSVWGSEDKEEPITIPDETSWVDVLKSSRFRNETPAMKRKIAQAYFDKNYANQVSPEDYEAEFNRFKTSSGLADVDTTGVSKESKGVMSQLADLGVRGYDWLTGTSMQEKDRDFREFEGELRESAGDIRDWIVDRPLEDKASDVGKLLEALADLGIEGYEVGKDIVVGPDEADFNKQYMAPQSETGEAVSPGIDRRQYMKKIQELENKNIDAALNLEPVKPIDAAQVRTEAEQRGSDIRRDAFIDVGTLPFTISKPVKGLDLLAKTAKVAKDTGKAAAAITAGEGAKNVLEGRDFGENVLETILVDRALNYMPTRTDPNFRAGDAAASVKSGQERFSRILSDASATDQILNQKEAVLKGFDLDNTSMKFIDEMSPEAYESMIRASEFIKDNMDDKFFTKKLEEAYKKAKADTPDGPVSPKVFAYKAQTGDPRALDWLKLKEGRFDFDLRAATDRKITQLADELNAGDVTNFTTARDLINQGVIGRGLYDVSGTAGASTFSKGTSLLRDVTSAGWTEMARSMLGRKASQKSVAESMAAIKDVTDTIRGDLVAGKTEAFDKGIMSQLSQSQLKLRRDMAQLRNAQNRQMDLNSNLAQTQSKLSTAERNLATEESRKVRRGENLRAAQNKYDKAQMDLGDAKAAAAENKAMLREARMQFSRAKQDVMDAKRELDRVLKSSADQETVNRAKNAYERTLIERNAAEDRASRAKETYLTSQDRVTKLEDEVKSTEKGVQTAQRAAERTDENITNYANEMGDLKDNIWKYDEELIQWNDKIGKYSDNVANQEGRVRDIEIEAAQTERNIATRESGYSGLEAMVGKRSLTDADIIRGGAGAVTETVYTPNRLNDMTRLQNAMAALNKENKRAAKSAVGDRFRSSLSARTVVNGIVMATFGLPAVAIKIAIPVINTLAQASQKSGLKKGIRLVDEYAPKLRELESKVKLETDPIKQAQLEKQLQEVGNEFAKKVEKVSDSDLRVLMRTLKDASRAAVREEMDEE